MRAEALRGRAEGLEVLVDVAGAHGEETRVVGRLRLALLQERDDLRVAHLLDVIDLGLALEGERLAVLREERAEHRRHPERVFLLVAPLGHLDRAALRALLVADADVRLIDDEEDERNLARLPRRLEIAPKLLAQLGELGGEVA